MLHWTKIGIWISRVIQSELNEHLSLQHNPWKDFGFRLIISNFGNSTYILRIYSNVSCHFLSLKRERNGHKAVCLLPLRLQCQVLFKKHVHAQTGSSRTACERAQGQLHSSAMDQIYLQSKEIQTPAHLFFKACYTKVEGTGKLLFISTHKGLCNQECKSHSTEEKQIKNC